MAKEILYGSDARNAMLRGVDKLANRVKINHLLKKDFKHFL